MAERVKALAADPDGPSLISKTRRWMERTDVEWTQRQDKALSTTSPFLSMGKSAIILTDPSGRS